MINDSNQLLSPEHWPVAARFRAESEEAAGFISPASLTRSGLNGAVCVTCSPIALQAGLQAMRSGGSAADAAVATALTQIATQLGSVVSYAGILELLYYCAADGQVYSLWAGYRSYAQERDALTIPAADLGPLNSTFGGGNRSHEWAKEAGRETLVPGFMAGISAMHKRFGKLPLTELFVPAIWYAENGVTINPSLDRYFQMRRENLARTPEGTQFLHQNGEGLPKLGDRFIQRQLAETLRNAAHQGIRQYMYAGSWAQRFVDVVRREGGRVTIEDLMNYRVFWRASMSSQFAGATVHFPGSGSDVPRHLLPALRKACRLNLDKRPPCWQDADVLYDICRLEHESSELKGTDKPRHSNAIVMVDAAGNIAAMTHTINSVVWGGTGIVVDGIPIPDSAGFQQSRLATVVPGGRLPNDLAPTIAIRDGKPVLATAPIGSSLYAETLKVLLSKLSGAAQLESIQSAPPLLSSAFGTLATTRGGITIPENAYPTGLVERLKELALSVSSLDPVMAQSLRGTVTAVEIGSNSGEPDSKRCTSAQAAGTLLWCDAY
jgi:gamma-glutamyltranspeptidase/glutathione hydrolase